MSKWELTKLIIERFYNPKSNTINLTNLDFGDRNVKLDNLKGKDISIQFVEATNINNQFQKAKEEIDNGYQRANEIFNHHQKAKTVIGNYEQEAPEIDNEDQLEGEDYEEEYGDNNE